MRKYIHHFGLIILGVLLPLIVHANDIDSMHLAKMQHLISNNLFYDTGINTDSIQLWEKQLSPQLEKEKQFVLLFQIKLLSIKTSALAGNSSVALDNARKMYQKAKEMNDQLGIGLALCAIGDTYSNSNNPLKGIESYEEAIALLEKVPGKKNWIKGTICQYIFIKLEAGQTQNILDYIHKLESYCKDDPSIATSFFIPLCYAYYNIQTNHLQDALSYLKQANSIYKENPFEFYNQLLRSLYSKHYLASKEYPKALEDCDSLLKLIGHTSYQYVQTLHEKANILILMGRKREAGQVYQIVNERKDSLDALRYTAQINTFHTLYQIDQKEISNQEIQKKIILWGSIVALLAMLLIIYFIFHIRDGNKRLLVARKKQEEARVQAEKSIRTKSLLLSNMSHEIRTPLNALSGFTSILIEDSIDDEIREQCNDIIQLNSELLLKLINDVIDLSDLEIGKMDFNFIECDIVNVCRNVIDMIEKVKQTNAEVVFTTQLESLRMITDSSRLQQLLINLLINATKFTPQGTITLELKQEEQMAVFSVSDTGCGIPKEKQRAIFNRFEKLNENAQGTGLGLSICQLIIEQLGGNIWIDPEYTEGSRFCFTHPIEVSPKEE